MVRTARATVAFSVVVVAALVFLPQMRDMLALKDYWGNFRGAGFAFHATLLLFALSGWYWSRMVLAARFRFADDCHTGVADGPRLSVREDLPVDQTAFVWLPRILFLAIAAGGFRAALWSAAWFDAVFIALWAGGVCTLLVFRRSFGLCRGDDTSAPPALNSNLAVFRWLGHTLFWRTVVQFYRFAPLSGALLVALLLFAVAAFLASALGAFFPASASFSFVIVETLGRLPGPGAFFVCAALLMGPLSFLTFWFDSWHVAIPLGFTTFRLKRPPVIAALVLLMIVTVRFVALHNVRVIEPPNVPVRPEQRVALADEWAAWRDACTDKGQKPLPIIIAISGGASRAALWGLRVLTAVDADIKDRPTGIFAVSSVSGGSLGAAAYVSALAAQGGNSCTLDRLTNDKAERERRDAFFRDAMAGDALGPVLAGLLWGDAARALLGLPAEGTRDIAAWLRPAPNPEVDSLMRGGDRADALEEAFERNWRQAYKAHRPFSHRVFRFRDPFLLLAYDKTATPLGHVPIWIANGADDQSGDRILTAPFQFDADTVSMFPAAKDALGLLGTDVPISTAIHNTARFPYLSPAGELAHIDTSQPKHAAEIIDGGYFENEGLATALELARWLRGKGADPIVVQATADADVDENADRKGRAGEDKVPRCGSEEHPETPARESRPYQLLAPVLGVYAARAGHSHVALREAVRDFCGPQQRFFHFYLYAPVKSAADAPKTLPMNWVLSPSTAMYIWKNEIGLGRNAAERVRLQHTLAAIH